MSNTPNVTKIRVEAYANKRLEGSPTGTFDLPINPDAYTQTFKVETERRTGHGNQHTDPRYIATPPEELRLDFYFDGTQTAEGYAQTGSVREQIDRFKGLVYTMNGSIHRPNFLKVCWGRDLTFPCLLKNLDVNYTLFNADGSPLRAKLTATFLNFQAAEERQRRERKQSPDLTRQHRTVAGDRLDVLTYEHYNDPTYVLQVAKANRLTTFRALPANQLLAFPPFDKTEV